MTDLKPLVERLDEAISAAYDRVCDSDWELMQCFDEVWPALGMVRHVSGLPAVPIDPESDE